MFFLILTIGASFAYDACDNEKVKQFLIDSNSLFQEQKAYSAFWCTNDTMLSATVLEKLNISEKEAFDLKRNGTLDKVSAQSICPLLDDFQNLGLKRKSNYIYFFNSNKPFHTVVVDDSFCKKYGY